MTMPSILKRSGKLWKSVPPPSAPPPQRPEAAGAAPAQGATHQVFVAHMGGQPGPAAATPPVPPPLAPLTGSHDPPPRTSVISGGGAASPLSQLLRVSANKTWVPPPSQPKGAADEAADGAADLAASPPLVAPGTILHQSQLHRSFLPPPPASAFAPAPPLSTGAPPPSAPRPASGKASDAAKTKHTMVLIPASFGLPSASGATSPAAADDSSKGGAEPLKYYLVFAPTSSGQGAAAAGLTPGRGAPQLPAGAESASEARGGAQSGIMSPQPVSSSSYLASLLKAGVPLVPVSSSTSLTQVSPSRSRPLVSSVLAPRPTAHAPAALASYALSPDALGSAAGSTDAPFDGSQPASSASGHPAVGSPAGRPSWSPAWWVAFTACP